MHIIQWKYPINVLLTAPYCLLYINTRVCLCLLHTDSEDSSSKPLKTGMYLHHLSPSYINTTGLLIYLGESHWCPSQTVEFLWCSILMFTASIVVVVVQSIDMWTWDCVLPGQQVYLLTCLVMAYNLPISPFPFLYCFLQFSPFSCSLLPWSSFKNPLFLVFSGEASQYSLQKLRFFLSMLTLFGLIFLLVTAALETW